MFNYKLLFMLLIFLTACSPEHDSPSSDILKNNLPKSGLIIEVSKNGELINIPQLEAQLNKEQLRVFNLSMQWIATESEVPFNKLAGKSAFEIVQIANCFKSKKSKSVGCIKSTLSN